MGRKTYCLDETANEWRATKAGWGRFLGLDGAWPNLEGKLIFRKLSIKRNITDKKCELRQEGVQHNVNIITLLDNPLTTVKMVNFMCILPQLIFSIF